MGPMRARPAGRWRYGVLLAGVLGLAVLWLLRPPPPATEPPEPTASAPLAPAPKTRPPETAAAPGAAPQAPGSPEPTPLPTADRLQQALEDYRTESLYPPGSRPHTPGTQAKLRWNEPFEDDNPLESGDEVTGDTFYRFGADRAHALYGEPLTTWLEVWRGDPTHRLPVTVHRAWVRSLQPPEEAPLLALGYRDDGADGDAQAGDLRYTNRFIPAQHPAFAVQRQVLISAEVSAGGKRTVVSRAFTYSARRVLEVLSRADALKDGSLELSLEVRAEQAGLYRFEANLLDKAGAPVGYAVQSFPLEPGRNRVELSFFGRLLVEHGVDGPYRVSDLRGFVPDATTGLPLWWSEPAPYDTRPYRASQFSARAWESPEKARALAKFQELLDATRRGEVGVPGQSGGWIEVDETGKAHVRQ